MAAVAIDLAAAAAAPTSLDMEVVTRAAGDAGGPSKLIRVDSDSALRSGDGIQVRLRVAQDAYVYVIHVGSSRSAMLLHPFSGRDEDALVRAGEQRAIPSAEGFLSLDRRTGTESLYAFASPAPLASLSSLLVRMEAVGADREAVTEMVREAYPDALALNFNHEKARTLASSAVPPESPTATLSAFRGVEEQGVLSAEGSRIQEFVSGKPLPPEKPVMAVPSAEAPRQSPPSPKPAETGSWLGKLFSLGGAESGTPQAAEPAEPATTFALPAAASAGVDMTEAPAADGEQAIASELSATVSSPAEKTADEARESEAAVAPLPAGANPQLDVATLDEIFASLDQPAETAESAQSQTAATAEEGIPSVGVAAQPEAEPPPPSPDALDSTQPAEAPAEGLIGTLGTLLRTVPSGLDDPPEVAAGATEPKPVAPTQVTAVSTVEPPQTPSAPQAQPTPEASSAKPATAPAGVGGLFTRLFGSAAPGETDAPAVSTSLQPAAAEEAPREPVKAAPRAQLAPEVSVEQTESEPPDAGGFFSRLFGAPSSAPTIREPAVAAIESAVPDTPSPPSDPGAVAAAEPAAAGGPPASGESESIVRSDEPASTVAIGPARSDTGGKKTVVIGPAVVPDPATGMPESQTQQAASETDPPAGALEGSEEASVTEAPSRGFLAGLFSSSPPAPDAPTLVEPAAEIETSSDVVQTAPSASTQAKEPAEGASAETVEGGSGGLLGGLAGLFAGTAATDLQAPEPGAGSAPAPEPEAVPLAQIPETESAAAAAPAVEAPAAEMPALDDPAAAGMEAAIAEESPETGSGGLLSGLAGLFTGAASTQPPAADTEAQSAPTRAPAESPLVTARESETVAAAAAAVEDTAVEASALGEPAGTVDAPTESVPQAGSGGLLEGLASLFSSTEPAPENTTASDIHTPSAGTGTTSRSPVVTTLAEPEPSAVEATDASAAEATGSGGIFGGLSRLFGGSEPSTQSSASEAQAGGPAESASPREAPEPAAAPAFKKVTRGDGQTVVILEGPLGRPDTAADTSEVLAAEGSKIRALLNPEPAPPAAVLAASPPAETTPRLIPSEANAPAADASLTASPQASVLNAGVTQSAMTTAAPVSVAPDEVQAALAAGAAAATRPAAETLAALTAPAAAPELEVAPVTEIDVTADDNVSSSIVLVVTPTGTGSGVLLDDAGHVLVNWHVVTGYPTVSVSFKAASSGFPSSELTFSARVVRLNKTADLALLRIDDPPDDLVPVRFADASQIHSGDVLHAIGHPASGAWTHTLGKISSIKPESSWYAGRNLLHRGTVLQAKVLDDPGSAGAPLFNNRLELVGINALSRTKKGVLTGVSVETIRLFLEAPPPGG